MNIWMTPARERLARQYVYDMINSFVEDPYSGNAYMEYDPPSVSFYSPDIELLLKKVCYNDLYSVKHPEFAVLHDPTNAIYDINGHRVYANPTNAIYDIDGHRVYAISGTVNIDIDDVASDRIETDKVGKVDNGSQRKPVFIQPNKFHVRLPK